MFQIHVWVRCPYILIHRTCPISANLDRWTGLWDKTNATAKPTGIKLSHHYPCTILVTVIFTDTHPRIAHKYNYQTHNPDHLYAFPHHTSRRRIQISRLIPSAKPSGYWVYLWEARQHTASLCTVGMKQYRNLIWPFTDAVKIDFISSKYIKLRFVRILLGT